MTTKPFRGYHPTLDEARTMREALGIDFHDGYTGMFTTRQAEGALANGTRVDKVVYEKGDTHPLQSQGTVLGSAKLTGRIFYFVEWDASPRTAVGVVEYKIAAVDEHPVRR